MWKFLYETKTEKLAPWHQQLHQDVKDEAERQHEINYSLKHGHDEYTAPHRVAKALDKAANWAMDGHFAHSLKDVDPHRTAALVAAVAAGIGAAKLVKKLRNRKR